jgi:pyridoxamine 5'-phosphate oxidase
MNENNPVNLFENWFNQAKEADIDKPNAMTLSTVDKHGGAQARIVLLSSFDEHGFVFHTNYHSEKGAELAANASACLLFWWDQPGLQVRINGKVSKTTAQESDAYFAKRPRGSQIGAWASEQSQVIASHQVIIDRVQEFEKEFTGKDVPRPPHWGGYRLAPDKLEFWVNKENRLHERFLFTMKKNGEWQQQLLAP